MTPHNVTLADETRVAAAEALYMLASRSHGGYVLIRSGLRAGGPEREWRVSVRWRSRDHVSIGLDLGTALARACGKLLDVMRASRPIVGP